MLLWTMLNHYAIKFMYCCLFLISHIMHSARLSKLGLNLKEITQQIDLHAMFSYDEKFLTVWMSMPCCSTTFRTYWVWSYLLLTDSSCHQKVQRMTQSLFYGDKEDWKSFQICVSPLHTPHILVLGLTLKYKKIIVSLKLCIEVSFHLCILLTIIILKTSFKLEEPRAM